MSPPRIAALIIRSGRRRRRHHCGSFSIFDLLRVRSLFFIIILMGEMHIKHGGVYYYVVRLWGAMEKSLIGFCMGRYFF